MSCSRCHCAWALLGLLILTASGCVHGLPPIIMPEQRTISIRDPAQLPKARIPEIPPPPTVTDPQPDSLVRQLSLDEAIRITLANTKVVRILAGVQAVSSGQTIYDPAILNTDIDQEQARFDPKFNADNTWDRREPPRATFDPLPPKVRITAIRTDSYNLNAELSKTLVTGGTASVGVTDNLSRFQPGVFPLNPQNEHAVTLNLAQPLLQGAGVEANMAPIVVARINTERSYFQLKDAMQDSVRGVIEAYWSVVFARTDVWVRQQQVRQGQEAFDLADGRNRSGLGTAADVAQSRSALANFRANLIFAEADLLQREAALRNILGMPPADGTRLIPVSPPTTKRIDVNWYEIVKLAEERRPDLIDLKLTIQADQQILLQAQNQALPKLDAISFYRWNGLNGRTPDRTHLGTEGDQYTDWTLGVNLNFPLGLRGSRAVLRQQELIVARDFANLDQGMHSAAHKLALSVRNLAQYHEQYKAYKEAREAALINYEQQRARYKANLTIFLNVLQAITDWGNAVRFEAQSLAQYNTELANLERETGTILETHGIHFFEELYGSRAPLCLCRPHLYPYSVPPTLNAARYPVMSEPAENVIDLKSPLSP